MYRYIVPGCLICIGRRLLLLQYPYQQARRNGEFSGAPRRLGAPPSLKNTEKDIPDGFFLTIDEKNMFYVFY